MKIIYLTLQDLEDESNGVGRKINSQVEALRKFCEVSSCYRNSDNEITIDGKIISTYSRKTFFEKPLDYIEEEDIIYLRYPKSDWNFLCFLKKANKKKARVVVEIPTYPYDGEGLESKKLKDILKRMIDRVFRKKLAKYIEYIVTFSDDKTIFDIPCINISNGINLKENKLICKTENKDEIVFTSVSSVDRCHGLDRFLNSLDNFLEQYPCEKVKFNIVGEGFEIPKLKQIVSNNKHLSTAVIFHGFKSGKDIDEIYNDTDIAVGSLGRHRSGLTSLKTLKNREYAAKGLPMIYSEIDPDFEGQPFVYKTTPDEEIIDIEKLILWYQNLTMKPEEIREYSKQFSWDIQMKKVIDVLQ